MTENKDYDNDMDFVTVDIGNTEQPTEITERPEPATLEQAMLPPPGADASQFSMETLTKFIGTMRALKLQRGMRALPHEHVREQPRTAAPRVATRTTTSSETQWCKMAPDGYTPLRRRPAMQIVQEYDDIISRPLVRTWTFRDQFTVTNIDAADITEKWTITYPCLTPELVARDITRAWQVYSTPKLDSIDTILLANTPLALPVDGEMADRYGDIWSHLAARRGKKLPSSTKWRVVTRHGEKLIMSA